MKGQSTGLTRIYKATGYSLSGLRAAWKSEAAIGQELILATGFSVVAMFVDVSSVERVLMVASLWLVVIVELLNSAIEATVDRIGEEWHQLSGQAKDIASAAVFISLLLAAMTWGILLWR